MTNRMIRLGLLAVALAAALPMTAEDPNATQITPKPLIYASPIHAGCYVAAPGQCRIHADPFTISVTSGKKLLYFSLVAIRMPGAIQTTIYNFKTDQSNPAPSSGSTYTPTLVTQDFAAACGASYEVSLQGQDTGDSSAFNLGCTGIFTCPAGTLP